MAEPLAGQWGGRRRWAPPRKPSEATQYGEFTFCRLRYQPVRREWLGTGWDTDYPDGDRNLPLRLSQLTRANIARDERGDPFHAVVSATDPDLYACPFLFASDVGTIQFKEIEAVRLRDYLLKGGFLWADDFWGEFACNRSVKPWRATGCADRGGGGAQRLRMRFQCLARGQSQTSLAGLPYCLAVS